MSSLWKAIVVAVLGSAVLISSVLSAEPDRDAIMPLTPELKTRVLSVLRDGLHAVADTPDSFWPAMHAAEALTLAGQQTEVVTFISKLVPQELDHQRRCGLARELVRAGQRPPLDVLFATLADEQSNGRGHAAESLYKVGELRDGKLMKAAYEQVSNPRLHLMAAAALGRTGDIEAINQLRAALQSDDRELRKIGVWVLGLLGDDSDVAPLRKLLKTEDDELARAYIINALACLNDDTARQQLGRNLSSSAAPVRTYSAEFAGYSRSVEFRPRLIAMLGDEHVDVRVRAAQTLSSFERPRSTLKLKRVAFDK